MDMNIMSEKRKCIIQIVMQNTGRKTADCRRFDMETMVIQIRQKGVITIPVELRRKYGFSAGDIFTLIDLGEGAFMLTPGSSEVARLGDQVAKILREEGVSAEDVLQALEEERED
jgi:bifunctional DNA-binding transcriptional regulator/antitoxin component of YhaV-PrlF toxin-antitoxin module